LLLQIAHKITQLAGYRTVPVPGISPVEPELNATFLREPVQERADNCWWAKSSTNSTTSGIKIPSQNSF
jgi:hypothetical protein